jgi:hypothetical protein
MKALRERRLLSKDGKSYSTRVILSNDRLIAGALGSNDHKLLVERRRPRLHFRFPAVRLTTHWVEQPFMPAGKTGSTKLLALADFRTLYRHPLIFFIGQHTVAAFHAECDSVRQHITREAENGRVRRILPSPHRSYPNLRDTCVPPAGCG